MRDSKYYGSSNFEIYEKVIAQWAIHLLRKVFEMFHDFFNRLSFLRSAFLLVNANIISTHETGCYTKKEMRQKGNSSTWLCKIQIKLDSKDETEFNKSNHECMRGFMNVYGIVDRFIFLP